MQRPTIIAIDQRTLTAMLFQGLKTTDLLLYGNWDKWIYRHIRHESAQATAIDISDLKCSKVIGEIDGIEGNMAAIWTAAAQPEVETYEDFDADVRQPTIEALRQDPYYYKPRNIPKHSIYSLQFGSMYTERSFVRIWLSVYKQALECCPTYQQVKSLVASGNYTRVFVSGMQRREFRPSDIQPRPPVSDHARLCRLQKGVMRTPVIIAAMLAGEI